MTVNELIEALQEMKEGQGGETPVYLAYFDLTNEAQGSRYKNATPYQDTGWQTRLYPNRVEIY